MLVYMPIILAPTTLKVPSLVGIDSDNKEIQVIIYLPTIFPSYYSNASFNRWTTMLEGKISVEKDHLRVS